MTTSLKRERLSLDLKDWPEIDQELWSAARRQDGLLDESGLAAHWRPKTARQVEKGYGLWIGYLARTGRLDPCTPPAARVTEENLRGYVNELSERISPISVTSRIRDLREMLRVMEHKADIVLLTRVLRRLEARARPNPDKAGKVVSSHLLFEAGINHINQSLDETAPSKHIRAARARNGLLVAFLAACPVRRANLAHMTLGEHLLRTHDGYLCRWGAHETKEGRYREFDLPDVLVPYMNHYLDTLRPELLGETVSNRVWISVRRSPMSEQGIYDQVTKTTKQALGHSVSPHGFRHSAATSIATDLPDHFRIAPSILGHCSLQTTQRHYDHARMIGAVRRSNEVITALRDRFREEENPHD